MVHSIVRKLNSPFTTVCFYMFLIKRKKKLTGPCVITAAVVQVRAVILGAFVSACRGQ